MLSAAERFQNTLMGMGNLGMAGYLLQDLTHFLNMGSLWQQPCHMTHR